MDELLHWLEIRITTSLRPRAEEIKALLLDHTYRSYLCEFLKNEDVHTLYIYFKLVKASLAASLSPPSSLQDKCICFLKLGSAVKLTAENIADHVMSVDCDRLPVKYFDCLFHQVYLPLLSHNNTIDGAQYTDKIIDILHKVTGNLEVIAGHTEGSIVLPIPSLELLRSTSQFNKQGAAIHIMETVVIGWIRQIKAVLKHEPLEEIKNKGAMAGIYQEKEMWDLHIHNLESISLQLTSAETREIVFHLEQAKNLYGNSISAVTKDVKTACHQAKENLTFLKTLINCFDQLQSAATLSEKQRYFFQMLHRLLFVWRHSRYYHQRKVFANLLRLMSNEVVNMASALLGNDGLDNPQLYTLLKEALKLCATFRGNYLDVKIKADEYNARKIEETHNLNKAKNGRETVCRVTMYEVPASRVFGRNPSLDDKKQKIEEDDIWVDSPWPLYSAPCFQNMNMFMERCNDVLDLVETMRHFEVLKSVSLIGGAGTSSLDTMVQDIWSTYCMAKDTFMNQVKLIFNTDKNNPFQKAFFELRTKIKNLEHQLGNILRISFDGCPTVASQLRLLEVFEGVSRRDIVKEHLKDKDIQLYSMFMEEIQQVKDMFLKMSNNPPLHVNMTPLVSKFLWIKGLQARISDPMSDLRKVSPITLEGDMGWELRHLYTVTSEELQRFENNLMTSWLSDVNREVVDCLKLPLLKTSDPVHDFGEFLCTVEINLNPDLMVYLREAQFFSKPPFTMKLPEAVATLVSSMDINRLKILSTRLETVVSKYNEVIKSISIHQRALFEKKLLKISEILTDGMSLFSWSMDESNDYAELASTYICTDLYHNFAIVTNNYKLINELTALWCTGNLDIFTCREPSRSYSITELMLNQKKIEHDLEGLFLADGHRIHSLVQQCFVACGIGEASPVWQEFLKHVDTIVLQGLKKVTVSSLAALLNTLLDRDHNGILTIEVELINGEVAFNPPLDQSTSDTSVMESIEDWLKMFLLRGSHIQGFSSNVKCGYHEYISEDEEALHLIGLILQQVESCVLECQTLLDVFKSYSFLWKNDVDVEFQNFLHGERKNETENEAAQFLLSDTSVEPQNQSLLMAEGAFILPKNTGIQETRGPLLKDFDSEISIYKAARDSIQKLPDHQQCQWLQADFRPIKQVLCAYALKWMWSLTKFLIDQTSATLKNLDSFLRRTEPQIESITGEERDTGSFMKMMRLFNEVSSKQAEMEVQFTVLQKTVSLLEKHEMPLPAECEILYKTMPARWNAMKTKVSLAKQRLGPRIQQEADVVSRDLEQFQHKLDMLGSDIENSEVYKFECTAEKAFVIIQNFNKPLQIFEREAKDLKELQDLLETTVVDFSILTNCKELLQNLSLVWQNVDSILQEHNVWKTKFWQEMNIKELQQKSVLQLTLLETLPAEVQEWDVYKQALEATNVVHLTLPLIEDLSNPAMRTRHWKQLVRQTGGMLRVTAESLKTMTLGDLLAMDLQKHTGDVKTTVQRAVRDVTTENSLKNCEEVWLSRIFDLSPHSRIITARVQNEELASSVSGSHYTKGDLSRNLTTGKGSRRLSRQSDRGLHLSKKTGRGSTVSLYESLQHIEDFGKICLLRNTDSVFEELEHHQLVLTSIQPYAEAGSFLDEVTKWQKKLQVIETTVQLWLSVQDKWTQLEEVFSTLAFRVAMPREAMLFADVHHHFCRLMKSVEENPNILQNCIRRGLQSLLDMLNYKLERCQRAVRLHLEHKRQLFPRLFFLSLEDSVNIMCYGYDLKVLSGYIVKMFHHVHSLIYQVNSENECNQILGVRSFCGEEFYLIQPLECSVPVENWLPRLVNSIKASLQHYLWAAVEDTNTVITRRREIHSAGARRVLVNKTITKREAVTEEKQMSAFQEKSENVSIASESHLSRHWVLDTPSDVAYLSTHVKFSQAHQHGNQLSNEAMQGCLKDLTEGIEYAAKILNEIPQKDSQLYSERNSKAERKGNGRDQSEDLGNDQDITNVTPNPTLSASDVVKLTNHILLLLYQRDVTIQILSGTAPIWMQNQPLCYQFDDNTKEVVVKIGNCEVFYGFEYQGSAKHTLLTPFTERILLSVMGAVSAGTDALCVGPLASGKRSTIQELSLILGKPLFCFNCTNKLNNGILQDICKGLAAAEAWVCLNGLEQLSQPNLSLLAQMLTQIHSAKRLRKETVTLELEEVPLNTSGMCFALIKRLPNDTQSYKLPGTLLNCFRIVGISKVPVGYILEAQLLLKGFSCITYLAQKLSSVVDSFAKLHTANYIESGTYQNEKLIGFSFEEIGHLLNRAGEILRVLKSRNIENQEQVENADEDWQQKLEDKAIVTAIYDCWLLQFSNARAQAFKTLLEAEWPHAVNKQDINNSNRDGLLPAVIAAKYGPGQQVSSSECTEESSVPSAIIKAAEKCHILPSNTFTSKVSHLVQLASTYQTVVITGPAGCGKTSCIKTFVEALKGKGKNISIDTVYTEALQSGNFLGFTKKNTGWIDGLLPKCLRKCCKSNTITDQSQMNILHLDGEVNGHEIEIMQSLFCGADFLILENNERIQLSKSFLLLWELDTLANVAPSILAHMGILAMASSDIDYRLPLNMWMSTQAEEHQPLLCQLIKTFLEPSLQFLRNKRIIHQPGMGENLQPRDLFLYETNVVQTFCRIAKALMLQVPDMLDEDIHTFFIFSCLWSFGGWLDSAERTMFSNWWRHTFRHHATFPAEGEVWDYHIDTDTRHFVRWHDTLSSFSVSHGQGMASEVFVHTQDSEQLLYLSSLLTTSGCPVLLAGDPGCGKSVLSHELLNALCLGDVAEMSELNIPINSSTDSLRLWECLKDRLEWRHGTLHTPAGNKKLLCLLDDLNLAKTNEHGVQPACEFVRQLIDQQNIYDPLSGNWKTISGVVYLATWNTRVFEHSPGQRQRLLRHFCTFHCKYPSQTEQFGIFSSILNAYFISGVTENKATCAGSMSSECIQDLIGAVTKVSIELQERLRTVFLGTPQRCHYIFTLRDLAKIFRNLCLSLDGGTSAEKLLRLWRHECDWVYGHRMSSSVDYNRYVQELSIAAEKQFMNEEEVQIIVGSQQPLFSNIVEDDGGLISTLARQQDVNFLRRSEKAATSIHILDGYQETFDSVHVKQLLTEALREYNKVNPRMSITFYQCSINLLCRLARNLGSPHGSAHTLLCGEGCPRYSSTIARLAAHISGFTVVQCGSQTKTEDDDQRDRNFKSQIVDCYVKAGLKGQRTLLLLTEEDIDPTALVYITEFVVSGSVSHLFTLEQQATIANAMRSEVINAGLTYSKENAWNLFLQAVKQNIRWLLIHSDMGATFYKWCIQFPSLVNALNVCYIPQWSREMLVEHAGYHLQELSMVTNQEKENVCYLLSSMHLSIIRYAHGSYSKITNATFENFAQCFGALMKEEYCMIMKDHDIAKEALVSIQQRLNSHEKLTDDLTHEKTVLEQHKEGTLKILQQIAQDKAVVEQKIHVVYKQLQKIKRLSVLLPQYQVALEKAEYKCSAILENIKDIVHSMDISALAELRSMQKPDVDIEELMASIIIILKSPNTDLTWAKGAKRQMANLDRFLNELISFHVIQLPQSTLELLEANIRKSQFTSENMEKKAAGNVAAASLMKWLQSAVQYFGTLTSKVKPLQSRVSEMTTSLIDAEQKMTILQQKKKTFLSRLSDLERGFEEATMHKNKQQQRTIEMNHKLLQSTQVAQLLEEENKKYASIVSSLQDRLSGIPGSTALAAGLVSYLGSYEHHYRQLMLTVEWPMAVKERGFPLMIDSIDPLKGRIIEFSMIFPQSAPSEIHDAKTLQTEGKNNNTENEEVHYEGDELSNEQSLRGQSLPVITQDIYIDFIRALILRLVKRDKIEKWLSQDWTPQQMENAAILAFSWQRPVLLIEPCFEGESWIKRILGKTENNQFSSVNLQTRQDRSVLAPIEKGILSGGPLILNNYSSKWDDLLMPLIDHCCAVNNINNQQDTSSIISFNGHRLLCPDYFKLYLAADELEPNLKPEISSGMTIINYSYSGECLLELLLRRAFEKLQPDLHKMLTETTNIILGHQQSLTQLENKSYTSFIQSNVDGDIDIISVSEEKKKISIEIEKSKLKLAEILQLRDMLYPIAQQGALLYSILKSLQSLAKEYDFTFDFFLNLFDKAIATQDRTKEDVFQINTFHEDSYLASPPLEDEEPEPQMDKAALTLKHKQDIGDAAPLPASPSEQHTFTLSPSQMQKIMDKSIQAVYQLLIQTLLPEHSTQACALLFLCVQHMEHANAITEEEVAFFLKGSSVFTDVNFNTNLNSPSWLPHERWEDVKALSNNSVQLSSLCDQIIQNDSEWERWYKSDYQDGENTDADANGSSRSSIFQLPSVSAEGSYLHDFHALLIIRAARPDCFPNAVCQWVKQLSRGLDFQSPNQSIENLAVLDQSTCGILVIEPSNTVNIPFYSGAILSHGAKPTIIRAAKELDIPLFVVSVKNDNEKEVKMALNETMKQIGWLVIENLHLASEAMLKNLFKSLQYASKMRASQKEERQMCVWLTSELGTSIPKDFLACLKKVSWHFLINQGRKKSLDDYIYVESPSRLLLSAITSALAQTNEEAFSRLKMAPPTIQRLYFGICVLHGLLQTQQIIPKTGLNHLADMSYVQMHQALHVVLSTYDKVKTCENNFYVAVVEEVNLIYSGLSQTSEDADYIEALVHEIISSTLNQEEFLVINKLKIPVPPEFVNPEGYSGWLADYMGAKQFKKEALLMYTDENDVVNTYASLFMLSLSAMYDSMQSSLALITDKHRDPVKQLAYLRRNIELVLEHLPPLIETDGINMLFKENISNDKWTSEESQNNYSNYVLLQECNWMNTNLTQIKDGISALSRCLLGGLRAIPENLKDIAEALHNGEVPRSWLPLHSCQTSHSISTWLEGLLMKYKQLKQWVRKGLFPFANSEKEALTCISLTGLVNPEALLLALRTEFAVHHGFLLHEVVLQCHITDYLDNQLEINMHSLYLKDLVLKGAAWDSQKQCLVESRDMVNPLPYVAIIPTLRNVKQTVDNTEFYQCPVYSDYTMQCCMMKLPLLATKPLSQWHLQKVSLFLNPDTAFTTPVEEPHPTKNRNRALLNSLTKMDTLSRSMVFNRPRRKLDSKTPAINNDDAITPLVSTSDEGLLNTANASIPRHFTSDTTDQITISGNNLASNQDVDIFHKGDVNDKHELDNAPYKNEDVNERGKDLAEGARFLEFHSDGAAVTVNEPSIREHLMEQIRETDYELSDNEQGPEDNNGSFDESVTEGYKEELDPKFQGNLAEGWQDNSDYAAGENQSSFI